MARDITTIGFDADDTLWHNERFFHLTQARFSELLSAHVEPETLARRLSEAERRNLGQYGFGIKGFTLSMIETALDVTGDSVPASVVREIISAGQEMLRHPIELLPHVREVIEALAGDYRLVVITKGDLLDQERKVAQSGLGELFDAIEIVSDKTPQTYIRAFMRHGDGPERSVMVGNSLKSDVLPAIEAGGWGVHVPYETTWEYERAELPESLPRFQSIKDLSGLPEVVTQIGNRS